MALYQNGILISGANKLPQMTYAAWQALPVSERPSEWICTDRSYSDLPASDVTYDNTDSGLSADNIQDAIDEVAQSGGSGGHVIQDASGTAVAQEPTMQFTDSHVSDDSENDKTVIENIKSVASADYSLETEDGLYLIPDGDGSVIEPESEDYVEVTADGVKTRSQILDELFALVDTSKLSIESKLQANGYMYPVVSYSSTTINVAGIIIVDSNAAYMFGYEIKSSSSKAYTRRVMNSSVNYEDVSNSVLSSGMKFRLYYGNKKAVVDLQTTANRCLYDSNTTVKQKIDDDIPKSHTSSAIYLNTLSWQGSESTFYYTSPIDIGLTNVNEILAATIGHWVSIPGTTNLMLYIRDDGKSVGLRSNTSNFSNAELLKIKVLYK